MVLSLKDGKLDEWNIYNDEKNKTYYNFDGYEKIRKSDNQCLIYKNACGCKEKRRKREYKQSIKFVFLIIYIDLAMFKNVTFSNNNNTQLIYHMY